MKVWRAIAWTGLVALAAAGPLLADDEVKLDGYLDFRKPDHLVVEGQRVVVSAQTKFKGKGGATSLESIPLGYEVKVKGRRAPDGSVVATQLEAKPNGTAMMENDAIQGGLAVEQEFGSGYTPAAMGPSQRVYKQGDQGYEGVERIRGIVKRLMPPYEDARDYHVYLVEDPTWNARAFESRMIIVHDSLLDDLDDDELAIILGHEIAHATHEHERRSMKKAMWASLGGALATQLMGGIKNDNVRQGAAALLQLASVAWTNSYSRKLEDQADRVGLRYAAEAGFDISKGPKLWQRFGRKYGEASKVQNFFLGNHSLGSERVLNLQREIAYNYPQLSKSFAVEPVAASAPPPPAPRVAAAAEPPDDDDAPPVARPGAPPAPPVPTTALDQLQAVAKGATYPVRIAVNQPSFKVGEKLVIEVEAPEDGYLNVIDIGEGEDESTVLFPNQLNAANAVKKGQRVTIPAPGWPFALDARLPDGRSEQKTLLVVLHTRTPIDAFKLGGGKTFLSQLNGRSTRSFMVVAAATQPDGYGAGVAVVNIHR